MRANSSLVHSAGKTILRKTEIKDIPGPNCGIMAGKVTDEGRLSSIVEVSGDNLQVINGVPAGANDFETVIYTYKRVRP